MRSDKDKRWTPEIVRQRIRIGMLVNRLQKCAGGRLDMTTTQIKAAGILLRKVLPDMVATEIERRPLEAMADNELLRTLADIRSYLAAQGSGAGVGDAREPARAPSLPALQ